jgi:amino acid adenylation domain-containing protein
LEHTQLDSWNDTTVDFPQHLGVANLIETQVATTPTAIAVEGGLRRLSYAELNAEANRLAHHLHDQGIGRGTLVGICMDRSVHAVAILLGILKCGAAYVPLDPRFPRDRLEYYVSDSQMRALIAERKLQPRLPRNAPSLVWLEDEADQIARRPETNPPPQSGGEDLAYVIYTSGSTGHPKGVQVLQRGVHNCILSMSRRLGLTAKDVVLSVTTFSFDIHVTELWMPLSLGCRVVMATNEMVVDGSALAEEIERRGVTYLQATPATYRLLLGAGWRGKSDLIALCGGEAFPVDLAEQLLPRVRALWNGYGPTETTVWSTMHRITEASHPIPIGRPFDNTKLYILDEAMRPVSVGTPGELYIGGVGVSRGYIGRPDLTAQRFLANPFRPDGDRIYKTGDLTRFRSDGVVEYLGRLDDQVKIRGHRIELGEVEATLARHPDIHAAVVVAHRDADAGDSLIGYVVTAHGNDVDSPRVRGYLQATLPDYMVPRHFVSVREYPLTPTGKIDRKALAVQPLPIRCESSRPKAVPRTDVERDLLLLWEEVLRVHPIGIDDDFFELGGQSFVAAKLVTLIRERLGHALPLGVLLEASTVAKMAAVLEHRLENGSSSCLVPLNVEGSRPPLFLIAGVGGHVFTFHKFARLLGTDQPSYGVKAIGVDGTRPPPARLEEIAALYLDEILATRRAGPYVVGGYSIGALVAFELAAQMQERHLEVGPLVVFDRPAPDYPRPLPLPLRLWRHVKNFYTFSRPERHTYVRERFRNMRRKVLLRLGLGMRVAPQIEGVNALPQGDLKKVWVALQTAERRYRPRRPFRGGVILFQASETPQWTSLVRQDPLLGWSEWALGPIEQHFIRGGHLELFHDRNIECLAAALKGSLRRWM